MKLHSMKLVTIVCEALARSAVTELLKEIGAHGYTLFPVEVLALKARESPTSKSSRTSKSKSSCRPKQLCNCWLVWNKASSHASQ